MLLHLKDKLASILRNLEGTVNRWKLIRGELHIDHSPDYLSYSSLRHNYLLAP
jgi:hypothetical protein